MPKGTAYARREFLKFMGVSTAHAAFAGGSLSALTGCISSGKKTELDKLPFTPLKATKEKNLVLADGFQYQKLISWGDVINPKGEKFGFDNDFVAFLKVKALARNEALLWVNHESMDPRLILGQVKHQEFKKTFDQVLEEQRQVGGSILRIRKEKGRWEVVQDDRWNRRYDATTEIPIVSPRPIRGKTSARGTLANCSGGVTPWGNILTCEENYYKFYGETVYDENNKGSFEPGDKHYRWDRFFPETSPEHFGWVVEINPVTGAAKKLTGIGRYAHESATVVTAKDGRCVVYSADDRADQCVYKFIANKVGSLESGKLYVANTVEGKWVSLDRESHPALKKRFKDQLELLIRCREAADIVGGTKLDRPEDIAVDPNSGNVFISQTNSFGKGNYFGSLLKFEESGSDPLSLTFKSSIFLAGGKETNLACPDNLTFDNQGNLWMTNDVSEKYLGKAPYKSFGNNGLFYIPLKGPYAGRVIRVATAPNGAELTGPCFSDDYKTLFLAVQHPGTDSVSYENPTTNWPDGGNSIPKGTVVQISGPSLEKLTQQ